MSKLHSLPCFYCQGTGTQSTRIGRHVFSCVCKGCLGTRELNRVQLAREVVDVAVHYRFHGDFSRGAEHVIGPITKAKDWELLHPYMRAVELGPLPRPLFLSEVQS